MEQDSEKEKFARAKIEDPDVRLPKAMLKTDDDPLDDLCYIKIFDNTQKAQEVVDTDDSGVKLERKVYRIRNKELVKVVGDDFEGMMEIQRVSKATIGILANAESNLHSHSFLDFVGTIEQVKTAEDLILDKVLKTYSSESFPIILMPPTIYEDHINIPLHKVVGFLGTSETNLLWIEMESGAWIKIEPGPSPGCLKYERAVRVFGPREHVNYAIQLIFSVISQHGELSASEALNELLHQLKEPSCFELIDGDNGEVEKTTTQNRKEAYWRRLFKRKKSVYGAGDSRFKKEAEKSGKEKMMQNEFKERTFLRVKPPRPEGSKQTEGEFKVPTWSQTFGHMKKSDEESSSEAGGSSGKEEEKKDDDVDKKSEDECGQESQHVGQIG